MAQEQMVRRKARLVMLALAAVTGLASIVLLASMGDPAASASRRWPVVLLTRGQLDKAVPGCKWWYCAEPAGSICEPVAQ
jgi:hypothetical protein